MLGQLDCCGMTDRGQRREINEDQFLIADLCKSVELDQTSLNLHAHTRIFGRSQGKLLMVADGMGGHAAGERASSLAVDSLVAYIANTMRWFYQLDEDCQDDFPQYLKEALVHCQRSITDEAAVIPDRRGMGTTLTMAYIIWPRMFVLHVGDSRCYLLRQSRLEQITRDHTLAQQLVESGSLSPEEAKTSRWSHILWNVLGGDCDDIKPEVYRCELELGDKLLLCSDGLTRHVSEDELVRYLNSGATAEQLCQQLIRAANDDGGSDNITAIVAHFRKLAGQTAREAAQQHDVLTDESRALGAELDDTLPLADEPSGR